MTLTVLHHLLFFVSRFATSLEIIFSNHISGCQIKHDDISIKQNNWIIFQMIVPNLIQIPDSTINSLLLPESRVWVLVRRNISCSDHSGKSDHILYNIKNCLGCFKFKVISTEVVLTL